MIRADLHLHTYYSDGLLSPSGLVSEAKKNGVEAIALTDHDTMTGCAETKELCEKAGLKFVSGIEISAYTNDVKIHTLGYGLDENSPAFKEFYKKLYDGSLKRADDIVSKLNRAGIKITLDDALSERFSKDTPVHVMHIASAGVKKTNVKERFKFYNEFLSYGRPAFSNICRPSPEQAIEAINESGGFASLAHPARIDMSKEELIGLLKRLKGVGLCGIEGVYTTHTITETAYYKEMAKAFGFVVTGGSDTHFTGGRNKIGAPVFFVDEALAEKLKI